MKRILKVLQAKNYQYGLYDHFIEVYQVENNYDFNILYVELSKSLIISYDLKIEFKDEYVLPVIIFGNEYNRSHNLGCFEYDYTNKTMTYSIKTNVIDLEIDDCYVEKLFNHILVAIKKYEPLLQLLNNDEYSFKQLIEALEKE